MDLMYGVHKKLTLLNQSNNTDQQYVSQTHTATI